MADHPIQHNKSVSTRAKNAAAEHNLASSSIRIRDKPGCPVVGIVASAGGLAAFTHFFKAMLPDTGAAFVVVPHLDATHESLMVELLSRHTSMPVTEATEGISVEVNHVYVIPPNHLLTIEQGRMRLSDLPISAGTQTAIDILLRSLAADKGERAIGIVLSGTGIDLTERKYHEAKQREQDLRFRKVFENVASGIAITDWEGVFEQCNPAYCDLLGYTEEELRRTQFMSLVHPDDQEFNLEKLQQLKSGEKSSVEFENRYIRKDGKMIWVHKYISVLPDATEKPAHLVKLVTNISLQRKAIEELQQSEEKTREIVALLPSQIAVVDIDGVIVATNPAWDRFARQNAGELERRGVGSSYFKVCEMALSSTDDSEVPARVTAGLQDVLVGRSDEFRIEYPCHSPSEKRWFLLQATPLKYGKGGAVVFHQNITDRVLSEQHSRYNENLLQLVMDTVPHYIYAKNREGVFVFVNQHAATQCGFASPSEMVGHCEMECDPGKQQAQAFREVDLEVIKTGIPVLNLEENFIDWQGGAHIVNTSKLRFPLPVTDEPAVLGVSVDITQRRLAEIKTQESVERLRSILNTASDAIITINRRGIIDSANQATMALFGYSSSELVGNNVNMLMPMPFRKEHGAYLQRFLATGEAHIIGTGREVICRRKDGSTFPADLTVSMVDHLGLFTGILRDISSRKELEKHALEIAANEQRRIGLELHDGTQQELAGLLLYANALLETIENASTKQFDHHTDSAAVREFDDAAYNRLRSTASLIAKRLSEASQHVRDLAHGIMPVQIDAEGLRSALHELAEFTNSDRIHCRLECSGDFRTLHNTTATHLYRIAQEALNNAIQHGAASQILISLKQQAQRISLEVADNGSGIDNTTIPRSGSPTAGMGLRTMEYRAGLIGGVIQIEKKPDGGTLVRCLISHEAANHD